MAPEVHVLRLGHRPQRDKRITTHVCLTARAFGASRVVLTTADSSVEGSVRGVVERFGGPFELAIERRWRDLVRGFDGPSLHLTMYGERHTEVVPKLEAAERVLVVVGAEKVPRDVYDLVTHNVAVGNQPHSEVAALSTVLYDLLGAEPLERPREAGEIAIEPSERGKRVRRVGDGL